MFFLPQFFQLCFLTIILLSINEFVHFCSVVVGAVVRLDPPRRRNENAAPRVPVLRAIMSNQAGRAFRILFWEARVAEFEHRILGQVCAFFLNKKKSNYFMATL